MKRVALYMRVSTDRQAQEGDSIAAQRDALHKYVDARDDLAVGGEYIDDGVSGTKYTQRDELQRMLADVTERKIDLILFTKLDRFYRSVKHYSATQELLDKYNVPWRAIWEPMYDTTTPQGRLVINALMSIAQFEAENTGQRIRQVFEYKTQKGEVVTGSQPPGYSIVDKRLVLNEEAPLVHQLFEHYAQHGSLHKATKFAADIFGVVRAKSVIKAMLKNKKYIGVFRDNTNYCPPIVDEKLFNDVQRLLGRNLKNPRVYSYIFSGLVYCAECGRRMTGAHFTTKSGKAQIRRDHYNYRCPKHRSPFDGVCENRRMIAENVLERYLIANIPRLVISEITVSESVNKKAQNIEAMRVKIQKKLSRLKELFLAEEIDLAEYKTDKSAYLAELEALDKEEEPQSPASRDHLMKYLSTDVFSHYQTFSVEEKQQFWRSFIKEIRFSSSREITVVFL